MVNIAFLDGGGSAQLGRWNGTEFEYVRDTGRAIPSVVCIYREPTLPDTVEEPEIIIVPDGQVPTEEVHESHVSHESYESYEESEMKEETEVSENHENPQITENHDVPIEEVPEAQEENTMNEEKTVQEQKTILGQVANLIDVKSIMTIILVVTLCHLVISGQQLDDKFMTIVTAVVTFYFSYQVKKQ